MAALVDCFVDAANTGKTVTLKGEQYTVTNAAIANDGNVLKARFLLVSVKDASKFFDFEVSARLYGGERALEK